MVEGDQIHSSKLSEDKLRCLIGLILQVVRVDFDLLDDCLHGDRRILEAWKEMNKLLSLIQALRNELQDSPSSPPHPVQVPLPKQEPQYEDEDNNDDDDEDEDNDVVCEEVSFVGTTMDNGGDKVTDAVDRQSPQFQAVTLTTSPRRSARFQAKDGNTGTRTETSKAEANKTEASTETGKGEVKKGDGLQVDCQKCDQVGGKRTRCGQKVFRQQTGVEEEKDNSQSEELDKEKVTGLSQALDTEKEREASPLHICHLCDKQFEIQNDLVEHLVSVHTKAKDKLCAGCKKTFSDDDELKLHQESCEGDSVGEETVTGQSGILDQKVVGACICERCGLICQNVQTLQDHNEAHKQKEIFMCHLCGKQFKTKGTMKNHLKNVHTPGKECSLCKKTFSNDFSLRRHERSCQGEDEEKFRDPSADPFLCRRCGSGFKHKEDYRDHYKEVHIKPFADQTHKCHLCGRQYKDSKGLQYHIRRHMEYDGGQKHPCHLCDKQFKMRSSRREHIKQVHGADKVCVVCSKSFRHLSSLKKHEKIHGRECVMKKKMAAQSKERGRDQSAGKDKEEKVKGPSEPLVCERCGAIFKNKVYLSIHIRRHKELDAGQTHSCHVCGKQFKLRYSLRSHIKNTHQAMRHPCTVCSKTFTSIYSLRKHEMIHTGQRPWKCTYCDKAFIVKEHCQIHMRRHTGERPFKCIYCDKSFIQKSEYNIHLRMHTGEKPFNCTYCGKAFARGSSLKTHLRIHTGERKHQKPRSSFNALKKNPAFPKPFQCNICGKWFKWKATLKQHMDIHQGISHICDMCNESFSTRNNLNRHRLMVHLRQRPFKCDVCGRDFAQKTVLELHMWTHRPDKKFTCQVCGHGTNDKRNFTNHQKKTGHVTVMAETGTVSVPNVNPIHQSVHHATALTTGQAPTLYITEDPSVLQVQGHSSSPSVLQVQGHSSSHNFVEVQGSGGHLESIHPHVQQQDNSSSCLVPPPEILYTVVVDSKHELY